MDQYLTFRLGDEEYGLEILKVQEIKGSAPITVIPNTPRSIKGVMNLRGTIVPVVDLQVKFAHTPTGDHRFAVVVVVTVGTKTVGLLVDAVSDVVTIPDVDIQPSPDLGLPRDARFISGMARVAGRLVVLLDVDQLVVGEISGGGASTPAPAPALSQASLT